MPDSNDFHEKIFFHTARFAVRSHYLCCNRRVTLWSESPQELFEVSENNLVVYIASNKHWEFLSDKWTRLFESFPSDDEISYQALRKFTDPRSAPDFPIIFWQPGILEPPTNHWIPKFEVLKISRYGSRYSIMWPCSMQVCLSLGLLGSNDSYSKVF